MTRGRWVGIALAAAALLASAPAAADHVVTVGGVTVELRDAAVNSEPMRVVGRAADGSELWSVEYHEWTYGFIQPLVMDGRLLYSRYGDLLELDVAQGRVVNRWRFPGRITGLAPGDATQVVRVTVVDDAAWDRNNDEAVLRYSLGDPVPGRSPWGLLVPTRSMSAGGAVAPRGHSYSAAEVAEGLRAAEGAELRDPTNPYYAYAVGRWLSLSGRPADAHDAFMRAASSQRAPWSDLFGLAAVLQPHDAGAARAAFDNGYERMLAAGVRPQRMQSLVASAVLFPIESRDNLRAAVRAGDVELAHELATRRWKVLPKLEGGPAVWRVLAAWFERHGRDDLGRVWRERAAAAEDGWLNRIEQGTAAALDLAAPVVAGMFFGVVFAALLAGLRLRRRGGWRVPASAVATVAIPIVIAMLFAAAPSAWVWRGNDMLFPDDTFGAPSVVTALEERPASPARDEVLAWARAESSATLAGQRHDGAMPDDATIAEAIMPTPSWWEGIRNADEAINHVLPDWNVVSPAYVDHWFEFLLVLVVPLILGLAVARFAPSAARWFQRIVPGGAPKLRFVGAAAFGAFAASALVVFGWYEPSGAGSAPRVVGLDLIWSEHSAGPSLWWYVLLVLIPLVQGVLVWRELRSDR